MKEYKFCQSCGMPKNKDKGNGGTEKDGSKSEKYCSYCYQNGEFFMKDEIDTPQKMQKEINMETLTDSNIRKNVMTDFIETYDEVCFTEAFGALKNAGK